MPVRHRLYEAWDRFGMIDFKHGDVFTLPAGEQIRKRFRKYIYKLVAYSRWRTPAYTAAKRLQSRTKKHVIVHFVEDKRVKKGQFLNYGIWIRD